MSEIEQPLAQDEKSKVSTETSPWTVANFSSTLKDWITRLGNVWVEGQLSQLSPRQGVFFGELRDLVADKGFSIHSRSPQVLRVVSELKAGDRVVALVHPDFWERSGKTSMDVLEIRKVGLGELLERIEKLRQQLISEGLTAAERKVPLPFLPNLIGLITGANSDAEKDVLENAKLRWPEVAFRIQHTPVQGDKAAPEIIRAIQLLDADPEVDVIIMARGGGSFQDLLVFSDESVVRAVAACRTPVVSAIGHENDRPLIDEVADLRASTPTDAAKRVVPDVKDERSKLSQALDRIKLRVSTFLENQIELIAAIRTRPILANPFTFIDERDAELGQLTVSLEARILNQLEKELMQVSHLRQQVRSLSPQQTLDRGYAVVRDTEGKVLTDPNRVASGTKLRLTLAKGELQATSD